MICKKCGKEFKTRGYIDGVYRNFKSRKYCLECSPFNGNNRKKLEDFDTKRTCSICNKIYVYDKKKGHRKNICSGCYSRIYRLKIKEKAVDYLGGECEKCGYNTCIKALEFHHNDHTKKDFTISQRKMAWDLVKKELDKCTLLCSNCHREEHYK